MGSIHRGMSGWIQEEEGAGMSGGLEDFEEEENNTVQVTSEDTIGVTSSECGMSEHDASAEREVEEDEERKELREEVSRLQLDLMELRVKYKRVRGEKRELRRRLVSLASERQVIEVEGGGDDAAAVGSEGGLEVGGDGGRLLAKDEFETLRLANDERAAEVEALVDRAGQEARRLREEKKGLVEGLQDAEQR